MNSITNYITNNSNEFNFFITSLAGSDWVQTANNNKQDALQSVNSLGLYNYAHLILYNVHTYSTQLFQLRFKVFPELSGKVEYERERLNNTVLKCGRPYK